MYPSATSGIILSRLLSISMSASMLSMTKIPTTVHAYPNPDPHAYPLARPKTRPQMSLSGPGTSDDDNEEVYRWVDPQDNFPGDNITFGASGPLDPPPTEDEQQASNAIISLDGILHYMPTADGVTHTRRFAVMPVTVRSARVLRGPSGFGCFLGSMPEYIRRAEEAGDKGMEDFGDLWRTSPRLSSPKSPAGSSFTNFVSGSNGEDGDNFQDQTGRNPMVSPAFFSTSTAYALATTRETFDDAVFLTCFTIPSSPSPPLASESNPSFDPATDILAAWLEFAPPEPGSDPSAVTALSNIASSFSTTSAVERMRPQDVQQYGFGAFVLVRLHRYSSSSDDNLRLGFWDLFQQTSTAALPMTLERAAIVYGPGSSRLRGAESELETDAECVAFGTAGDESAEGDGDGVQQGGIRQSIIEAEGLTVKARFGMRQQFMGTADGSGGAERVGGLYCFEGMAPA